MIKKSLAVPSIIIIAIVIASIFGIIHDQITYTISPEYYTKFKFSQFGLNSVPIKGNERYLVSITGIIATWWVGLILGITFSISSLLLKTWKIMLRISFSAMIMTIIITAIAALVGYLYGKFILINSDSLMNIYDVQDFNNFIAVDSIHTASYIGGFVGMFLGIIYIVKHKNINTSPKQYQ